MIEFVKGKNKTQEKTLLEINKIEKKYHILFPKELRDFYLSYNNVSISLRKFTIDGYDYEVAKIIPLDGSGMNFESVKENDLSDGFLPKDLYPLARDRGGNMYYWSSNNYRVFFIPSDDFENPVKVANSIKEFFNLLG